MASVYEMARQRNADGIDLVACAALQREIDLRQKRNDEQKPERKEQHRRWNQTEAGKASMKRRGARYRATAKGRLNAQKKSTNYYRRHKDDPEFKARKMEQRKKWLKEHPEQAKAIRHRNRRKDATVREYATPCRPDEGAQAQGDKPLLRERKWQGEPQGSGCPVQGEPPCRTQRIQPQILPGTQGVFRGIPEKI